MTTDIDTGTVSGERSQTPSTIRKGYCSGCPFNWGDEATEMAYNLACLPSIAEVMIACTSANNAWACHSEPEKVCCGFAATAPDRVGLPLMHVHGVHSRQAAPLP